MVVGAFVETEPELRMKADKEKLRFYAMWRAMQFYININSVFLAQNIQRSFVVCCSFSTLSAFDTGFPYVI